MALSSISTARKSITPTEAYYKPITLQKQIISVHTGTPQIEHHSFPSQENQVYTGDVNLLSIM